MLWQPATASDDGAIVIASLVPFTATVAAAGNTEVRVEKRSQSVIHSIQYHG